DVLHLIRAERGHRLLTRAARRRLERTRALELQPRRRLLTPGDQAAHKRVAKRPLAVSSASNRLGDRFIDHRQVRSRRGVEMLDALRDRPAIGAWRPIEVGVAHVADDTIALCRNLLELIAKIVELGSKRYWRRHALTTIARPGARA